MNDKDLMLKVYNDPTYPDYLKTVLSYTKTKDGRKDKVFDVDKDLEKLYIVGNEVRENFVNSEGKKMYRYFYFGSGNFNGKYTQGPQIRGTVEYLIFGGARFVE